MPTALILRSALQRASRKMAAGETLPTRHSGARRRREPGIHTPCRAWFRRLVDDFLRNNVGLWLWIPGSRFARPGMTERVLQVRHDGQITGKRSSPKIKNISLYQNSDLLYQQRCPAPNEGRFGIVTTRRATGAMGLVRV